MTSHAPLCTIVTNNLDCTFIEDVRQSNEYFYSNDHHGENNMLNFKFRLWDTILKCDQPRTIPAKGVGMIRVNFGPISETVYIDIIVNTIIKR